MQVYLSLDYELFLQDPGCNIQSSLIEPTNRLNAILEKNGVRAVYFVDAGYIAALNRQRSHFAVLNSDYEKVADQLISFNKYGHEIGLHIHPHWEDTYFDGAKWLVDLSRFKLADFDQATASHIFKQYYALLTEHTHQQIVSYRAGGWCIEPFSYIRSAMKECGISIDSTVYHGGKKQTATHSFDFTSYPNKDIWHFELDPFIEDANGFFTEIPSATYNLHPRVFWRLMFHALIKKITKSKSGNGVKPSRTEILSKLIFKTTEAVSIDSFKSTALLNAFKQAERNNQQHFCIIGHPKCFTQETYHHVKRLVEYALLQGHTFSTFNQTILRHNNI